MEGWKRFLNEEKIQEGILSRVKSKLQRSFGKEVVSGRITPFPAGEGNWLEISVPYSEADVDTISQDTLLFLAIVDKMAEELGFKEPVVTSGYRDGFRQAAAMYTHWSAPDQGTDHLVYLYGEKCKSCSPEAGETAKKVGAIFDEVPNKNDAIKQAGEYIESNLMSMHQTTPGKAVDFRLRNHPDIGTLLARTEERNYFTGEVIDETQNIPPHWHVSVEQITPQGMEYLRTPNEEPASA
tara:strand:+ start:4063 stop:4779 length:717 start_codon:yes stop_codon:yes gene_type:complete